MVYLLLLVLAFLAGVPSLGKSHAQEPPDPVDPDSPQAIALRTPSPAPAGASWFPHARLGMFLCWSDAVVPKSAWKQIGFDAAIAQGDPAWYFNRYKIPLATWRKLPPLFNPQNFNADAWLRLASDAGMKYLIFTTKHHDGFAMYDSPCSPFDVVDATPFGRDPLKDIAIACRRHGVRLCLYYSHAQDWEHPDGANNTWDFDRAKKRFARYFEEKCKPQVRELLTQYGPIGLFWFDTPAVISKAQSRELYDLVKSLQPDCLVNSRIGHGFGDYMSMGDSQFPDSVVRGLWETASTTAHEWYYSDDDHQRLAATDIIRALAGNVSRGGNTAFNFAPDYNGVFRKEAQEALRELGEWMRDNSEAIYENTSTPYYVPFEWGVVSQRPGFLYLHVLNWPGRQLELYGLENQVFRATLLANAAPLHFQQTYEAAAGLHRLLLDTPLNPPDVRNTVIRLKIDGHARVQQGVVPQHGAMLKLETMLVGGFVGRQGFATSVLTPGYARILPAANGPHLRLTEWGGGYIEKWINPEEAVSWDVFLARPGVYDVYVVTAKSRVNEKGKVRWLWDSGHEVRLEIGSHQLRGTISEDKMDKPPVALDQRFDKICRLGSLMLPVAGKTTATFRLLRLAENAEAGLTLRKVVLVPKG